MDLNRVRILSGNQERRIFAIETGIEFVEQKKGLGQDIKQA